MELGMQNTFDKDLADYSGINGHRGLSVSSFLQLTKFQGHIKHFD
jgi:hypothetical protein